VVTDGVAIPAHKTPFARDAVFGYTTAFLPDYVEEKTAGRIPASKVRLFGPETGDEMTVEQLRELAGNACCAVSAENQGELDRFAKLARQVSAEGKRFLFRSAASLLTSLANLPPQAVAAEDMSRYVQAGRPGLVLVGSHVPLSTSQLENLLNSRDIDHIEIDVADIPDPSGRIQAYLSRRLAASHGAGRNVVVSTSRTERRFESSEEQLLFGAELSAFLMCIVQNAPPTLGYIIGKGGITSNDVLSVGLGLRTARVAGQIHPGCSVVLTPGEHRFASIPIVIFPGNVGSTEALTVVYSRLTGQ